MPMYIMQAAPTNGYATASLVLGIITAALTATILGVILTPIPAILGVIFGIIGHNVARANGGLKIHQAGWGTGLALTPLILVAIALIGRT